MDKTPAVESTLYKGKVAIRFLPDSHAYYVDGKRKTGVTTFIGIVDKSRALIGWATELYRDFLLENFGKLTEAQIYEGCDLHSVRKQEAADTGTKIHDWCERYIRYELKEKGAEMPEMPEDSAVQIGAMAFMDWAKEHKVKFLSTERVVYSKKHDFIGTMDIEAKIDGKLCLVDLKSSNGLYNTVRLQTAAYVLADQEESGKEYEGRWAIRLAKETEKEHKVRMDKKNLARARRGKDAYAYPAYQVFEAKFLDETPEDMKRDMEAFLSAKNLYRWNNETDFFKNRE